MKTLGFWMLDLNKKPRITILTAFMILTLVIIFLLSGPHLFSTSVSFIDTELSSSTGNEDSVRVKVDFNKQTRLDAFPYNIGEWKGRDEGAEGLKEQLGADTVIKRAYHMDNPFQPVFLLLMQSASKASFHPPTVCYPALGYKIEEETKDVVYVKDTTWVDKWHNQKYEDLPDWAKEGADTSPVYGQISVKKLIVADTESGDRRVVLYLYIKDKKITSNKISMLRVSVIAPPTGTCEEACARAREFMGEVVPLLFEPETVEQKTFIRSIIELGIGGYFIVVLLFSIPIGLAVVPILAAKRKASHSLSTRVP